jgi:hypothetical protein
MKPPKDVTLSREEGEALIERLERNALSAEDRRVLVKVLTFHFWLLFALREAKLSLKRLKALVFGGGHQKPGSPALLLTICGSAIKFRRVVLYFSRGCVILVDHLHFTLPIPIASRG